MVIVHAKPGPVPMHICIKRNRVSKDQPKVSLEDARKLAEVTSQVIVESKQRPRSIAVKIERLKKELASMKRTASTDKVEPEASQTVGAEPQDRL